MRITSPSFTHGGAIPRVHTCQGDDTSPELRFEDIPAGTKSLALIVDDPDVPDPANPRRVWVHWVLYDLPPTTHLLPAAVPPLQLPPGTQQGKNDWGRTGFGGPCPPIGRHRYFFKLYALDAVLERRGALPKSALLDAMEGHVLASAELVGTYLKD
ncbi:MAG: YbhB/YbcL family Raf kinase inhibitor-like protein [Deltaproteobacteria bacterium]|nr:MAG: YbhB/YbcL family Raf kinase inhibitor-like protein [Deltaproteobacteria bacterium]